MSVSTSRRPGSVAPQTPTRVAASRPAAAIGRPAVPQAPSPSAVLDLLAAARRGLAAAALADSAADRFATAHLAALRAAAAVLASRATPRRGSRNAWVLLARVAPELAEWAAFFASTATVRAAIEAGRGAVTARRADDLMRDAETFVGLVETLLLRAGDEPASGASATLAVSTSLTR